MKTLKGFVSLLLITTLPAWSAGDIKNKYGTSNQTITITIASLTTTSVRGSTAVDNTSNVFQDVIVACKFLTAAASTSATGTVNVYAYGTADGGTTYQEAFAGTDGAVTLTAPPNVRLIAVVNAVANAVTYYMPPSSAAQAFGGLLPDHWGIMFQNSSGATLQSGNCWYQGVLSQYTSLIEPSLGVPELDQHLFTRRNEGVSLAT